MPAVTMQDGSRVLPTSCVLPGELLEKDMIWGGLPAEPILPTENGQRMSGHFTKRFRRTHHHIATIPRLPEKTLQSQQSGYLAAMSMRKPSLKRAKTVAKKDAKKRSGWF